MCCLSQLTVFFIVICYNKMLPLTRQQIFLTSRIWFTVKKNVIFLWQGCGQHVLHSVLASHSIRFGARHGRPLGSQFCVSFACLRGWRQSQVFSSSCQLEYVGLSLQTDHFPFLPNCFSCYNSWTGKDKTAFMTEAERYCEFSHTQSSQHVNRHQE